MTTRAPTAEAELGTAPRLSEQVLACLRGNWKSLVVVPAGPGHSALPIAEALVEASNLVNGRPAKLFKAERLASGAISGLIVEMVDQVESGGLAVVAIDAVVHRQSGLPLVMSADAALLCVYLGVTTSAHARRTVELIGRERFVGALTLEPGALG